MTHRSPRALTRRLALALSLMLLASMLALPAVADSHVVSARILEPSEGSVVYLDASRELLVRAQATPGITVRVAVRTTDRTDSTCSTRPDLNGIFRDITNTLKTDDNGVWEKTIDVPDVATNGWYCFAFDPSDGPRISEKFFLTDAFFKEFESDEIRQCDAGDLECSIEATGDTGQSFTASTDARGKDGGTAFLGLRIATDDSDADDSVANAVADACAEAAAEVNRSARLGPEVFQLVPVNFAEGSITVQSTIPRDVVFEQTARGAGIFQVCIAAEDEVYGGYGDPDSPLPKIGDTGLYGPVILANCDEDSTPEHACVLDKTKVDGDVVLTYQLPTVDPWGMS